jgi:hypothetical protein
MVESAGPLGPSNHCQKHAIDERAAAAAGSLTCASRAAQAQFDGRANALVSKAVDMALRGDAAALRLCIERILPARKESPLFFNLAAVRSAAGAESLMAAVIEAMARGDLTPSQAAQMARPIDVFVRTSIAAAIERDLADLRKTLRGTESEPGRKA